MPVKCLINAGPTREYFDDVRFVSNPSSGKFGTKIAKAALKKGWQVCLVLGACSPDLSGLESADIVRVVTSQDMYEKCSKYFDDCDIFIASAAVCDMRPKTRVSGKVKKFDMQFNVEFEPTIDILKTLSKRRKNNQFLAGFAAETENLQAYAKRKLSEKNLDCVIANNVSNGRAFERDCNEVSVFLANGQKIDMPYAEKEVLAEQIVDIIERGYLSKNAPSY